MQHIAAAIEEARTCRSVREAQAAGAAHGRRIRPNVPADDAAWGQAVGRYPMGHPIRAYLEHARKALRQAAK